MKVKSLIAIATLVAAGSGSATPCGPQKAAEAGSAVGYQRDKAAAEDMEKRTSESSDVLSKCVAGITTVTVVPTFPSLADIFAGVVDKACRVSIDKVRSALPPGMPGVPVIPGLPGVPVRPGDLAVGLPGLPGIPAAPTGVPLKVGGPAPAPAPKSEEFWKRIWR